VAPTTVLERPVAAAAPPSRPSEPLRAAAARTASRAAPAVGGGEATVAQGLLVLGHVLTLLRGRLAGLGRLGRPGVRRGLCFGAVGASGLAVNTGTVLALAALGFDGLSWPLWLASELSVLWNYHLHRRLTWRDRLSGCTASRDGCATGRAQTRATAWPTTRRGSSCARPCAGATVPDGRRRRRSASRCASAPAGASGPSPARACSRGAFPSR
jgi:hypothetical protein